MAIAEIASPKDISLPPKKRAAIDWGEELPGLTPEDRRRIGANIKDAREASGKHQSDVFGPKSGQARQSRLELGVFKVTMTILEKEASAFGVTVEHLLRNRKEPLEPRVVVPRKKKKKVEKVERPKLSETQGDDLLELDETQGDVQELDLVSEWEAEQGIGSKKGEPETSIASPRPYVSTVVFRGVRPEKPREDPIVLPKGDMSEIRRDGMAKVLRGKAELFLLKTEVEELTFTQDGKVRVWSFRWKRSRLISFEDACIEFDRDALEIALGYAVYGKALAEAPQTV